MKEQGMTTDEIYFSDDYENNYFFMTRSQLKDYLANHEIKNA